MRRQTIALAALAVTALAASVSAQPQLRADNIDEVLAAMTLQEKAMLTVGGNRHLAAIGFDSDDNGMIGSHAASVPGAAGMTQAIPRLGIPSTVLTDGPAGVRIQPRRQGDSHTYYCTGFPVGTALACTWNTELVEQVGRCIGNEVLEYGCDVLLAPGLNIHRSPLSGRNFEYFSEDPFVTGKIAAAYVRGVQSQGVGTSIKHFAVNSQETARKTVDEQVSQRAMREIYLKGFEIAVREARPWTVMSSYNKVNGVYAQESRELLTTILRDEWGFDGIVMTDWTDKRDTPAQLRAGNDLMEPGHQPQIDEIVAKVKSGELAMADLDACVRRILQYIVRTPSFRHYRFSNTPDLKAHAAVTRSSATEGMVLLKNTDATLPLNTTGRVSVFGITSYCFIAGGTGSGDVNKAYIIDMMTGLKAAGLDVNQKLANLYAAYRDYQGAVKAAGPDANRVFWGTRTLPEMPVSRQVIDIQARESDVAIVTLGRQAGEGMDRTEQGDFTLTPTEQQLLSDVCAAFHLQGKRVVVVLNMGNVLETASWKGLPDAILLAWQPGQEGGYSVADVLTGRANPSGKLSMTWPIALSDLPSSANFPNARAAAPSRANEPREFTDYTRHAEELNVGYRYFVSTGRDVSYPFGYGLSYTTFSYSRPAVKATADGFTATVTVTNTGSVSGKEAVQLYVTAPAGGLHKPARELKAFAKTRELKPGESQQLAMPVTAYELASFNEDTQAWETAAGTYTLHFAASSTDIRATALYTQKKAQSTPCHNVLPLKSPLSPAE